jgi:glutathione S-transferase
MIELYHADMSTCAQKIRLLMAEKGLQWEGHLLNLRHRDQHAPDYLKLNPNGVVPTLVHDGIVILESTVICEYLDDAFPDPPVRPKAPAERARMRQWTKWLDEVLHYYTGVLSGSIAFRHQHLARPADELKAYIEGIPDAKRRDRQRQQIELGMDAPQFADAVHVFNKFVTDLEAQLRQTDWMAGGSYSLAEIGYTPYLIRLDELQLWSWMDDKPHVTELYERIKARANFQPGYLDWRNDAYCALMAEKGAEAWPRIKDIVTAK